MTFRSLFDYHRLDMRRIKAVIISSVVPPLNPVLEETSRQYFGVQPLEVGPGLRPGLRLSTKIPVKSVPTGSLMQWPRLKNTGDR